MGTTVSNHPVSGDSCQSDERFVGKGKDACTKFKRLSTDGVFSIVECAPLTGRTHQIRAHLQYLGHPIANDALYASQSPPKRTEVGTNAERAARLEILSLRSTPLDDESSSKRRRIGEDSICSSEDNSNHLVSVDRLSSDNMIEDEEDAGLRWKTTSESVLTAGNGVDFVVDPMCTHCPNLWPSGYEGKEHGLWLHCKSYSTEDWRYECPLPSWAKEPS